MALIREFKFTVVARAQCDPKFRQALFTEAVSAFLVGETLTGKAVLRDLVSSTVGFEGLAAEVKQSSKSLHRMLTPHGNLSAENFFGIVRALQKETRVRLRVTADRHYSPAKSGRSGSDTGSRVSRERITASKAVTV